MNAIIEIKKLTKYYGKTLGIKSLDLDVIEGEIFGFIGPNGAGKSTTIRLLLDLIRPTAGSAKIFGKDIHRHSVELKQDIGYLPGEIFLPENLTGKSCINYFKSFKETIDDRYLKDLKSRFEFDDKKKISQYSKGNKQKLAIILALMHKPKLLILDEPTSGLDPLNQQEFYKVITETKEWRTTTFFSTHILDEAEFLCDRVGIIKDGRLLQIEDIDKFKEKNIREINLETTADIPLSALKIDGVEKTEKTDHGYRLITKGHNGELIKIISKFAIDDIKISEPSLEEIFMHFYEK
ncbi:MAG: ABC transporter ATP-binding protein [Patescibacteria group bacterium]